MGTLNYGSNAAAEIDDASLFHLDVLLVRLRGECFQLHVGLSAGRDGNLLSLAIGPGVSLSLEYLNSPELSLDMKVIDRAIYQVQTGGFVSIPFAFGNPA